VSAKIKILYLEFVNGDAALANNIIKNAGMTCQVLAVNTRQEYINALKKFIPDIVLSDDALPSLNTIDALTILKEAGLNIPLIAVTEPARDNLASSIVTIMKKGAYDYILKDQIATLPAAIISAIKKHRAEKITNRDISLYMNTIDEVFFSRDMLKSELIQISPGCESVYGYNVAEFLADPGLYAKIYHPDDVHMLGDFVARMQKGEQVSSKYRIIHKDTSVRWIESKIIPTKDEKGTLIHIDGVSRDITAAKAAEAQLKLSEQRYRQIVETAQEGIWILDENMITTFVNKKVCDMLGYSAEEMIGKHHYDFKDDVGQKNSKERLITRKPGTAETHESAFITKSGKQVFCIVATNGLFDADGTYIGRLAMLSDITRRKADEDALRRSEANLSAIIENTTDLVYSLDTNFKLITYNKAFKATMKQVYGFDIAQGTNILSLLNDFSSEMAAKWKDIYQRAFTGETQQFVFEYDFGLEKVSLSYSVNPILERGKMIGLSCFSRNISRQKLDETAIKQSAANLTAIIENTDASIYSLDTNLKYITFNKLFKDNLIHAYNIAVKPGDDVMNVLQESDPESIPEWKKNYASALAGQSIQFTKEFNFGDTPLFLSFSINPIWENDSVIGLSCAARDTTRQKMDEIAVKKSEASLRTIFNNTDMACMLIDSNGKIVSFNTRARKFSETQNRTIREGYHILDWVDYDRREIVTGILNEAKNGGNVNYQASRNINGSIKWYDMTWAGIKDREHQDFGYVFTIKDITRQKKFALEREKITSDLLQRNKALEQFTYIISHNLRAPVANIIGLSTVMDGIDVENDEICEIISSISKSANKLDEVISDLNRVLQVNQDINENIESILLPQLIDDIKFSIRHLIEKENVSVWCDFEQADELHSIKSFIYSIFYNLILNSIKYRTPGKQPVINICTRIQNGKIRINYKDNGRGIDTSRYADQLFGLYKRFDTSVEGKGMGLFMVKMQVESLGGTVALHSELNQGAEFVLEFPQMHLQIA